MTSDGSATGTTRCGPASSSPTASWARSCSRTRSRRSSRASCCRRRRRSRRIRTSSRGNPCAQPVARRLLRRPPGPARRDRPDLHPRPRGRHGRRPVDRRSRPARRHPDPEQSADATWVEHQLYDPYWDPLWALCADLGVPVNAHGGTGVPDFGKVPAAQLLFIAEFAYFAQRPFLHLLMSGVFEPHPDLTFVMTEMGAYWLPPLLRRLDLSISRIRDTGSTGELRYGEESILPRLASEYFQSNCYVECRPEGPRCRGDVGDRFGQVHVGFRLPARRRHPTVHPGTPATAVRRLARRRHAAVPRRQRCRVYGFDLDALMPLAAQYGPTVDEITKPLIDCPTTRTERSSAARSADRRWFGEPS